MSQRSLLRLVLPQLAVVAVLYLISGAALAAIPLFLARELKFGPTVVGLVTGLPFLLAIGTRVLAGTFADRHGPKRTLQLGFGLGALAGAIGLIAVALSAQPAWAAGFLLLSRIFLTTAEGYVVIGAQTWGLALAGPSRSGLIVGWVGTAMFGAMAAGAPIGGALFLGWGYGAVTLVALCGSLVMFVPLMRMHAVSVAGGAVLRLSEVVMRILWYCVAIAFVGFSYGSIVSFSVLLFEERNMQPSWAALTLFSVGLVVARVLTGGLPDRFGGTRVALWSLVVLNFGMMGMALAPDRILAFVCAFVAGVGYALVFPAIGREALARIPDRNRGSALAVYSSAVFVTLGVAGPFLGLMASHFSVGAVFLFASLMGWVAIGVILRTKST